MYMFKGDIFNGYSFHTENVIKCFSMQWEYYKELIRHTYCTKCLRFEKKPNMLNRML